MKGNGMKTVGVVLIVLLVVAVGAGIGFWYWSQGQNYVSTDNATVDATTVSVSAMQAGTLATWTASVGDKVHQGAVLGTETVPVPGQTTPRTVDIQAPMDGTIVTSTAVVGQMVAPGATLARVGDLSHAFITANVKETRITDVKVGQEVDVTVDAFPGVNFTGKVERIGRATASSFSLLPSQNTTANFTKVTQVIPVRIAIVDRFNKKLSLGQSAEVKIHLK